jgi:Fe-S cluster assembly protein SufD
MSIQTASPIDEASIVKLSNSLKEPSWLTELRKQALLASHTLELPKLEKTRIDRWKLDAYGSYQSAELVSSVSELPEKALSFLEANNDYDNLIVQRNSTAIYKSISEELSKQGVIYTDLASALNDHSELIQQYFMKAVHMDENKLTALHTAIWNGGVFLYVPAGLKIETPLQSIFLTDDVNSTFAPHILIIVEANSSVTYVDNYTSTDLTGNLVHNGIVEVFAKKGSHVQFASVHSLDHNVIDLCYRRAIVDHDARIDWIIGEMNDGEVMSDTTSVLKGNGSSSDAKVICVGTGDQKLNITTRAVHHGLHTTSDMITRAVLRDSSTAIINGITKIEKGATHSNGNQTERVLMLSPTARGDANPLLLIDEDEVKAGHAASVGQVNAEQIHYLMSRGIPKDKAMKLIIYGFLAPVVAEIPIAAVEQQLRTVAERKLGQ